MGFDGNSNLETEAKHNDALESKPWQHEIQPVQLVDNSITYW